MICFEIVLKLVGNEFCWKFVGSLSNTSENKSSGNN